MLQCMLIFKSHQAKEWTEIAFVKILLETYVYYLRQEKIEVSQVQISCHKLQFKSLN